MMSLSGQLSRRHRGKDTEQLISPLLLMSFIHHSQDAPPFSHEHTFRPLPLHQADHTGDKAWGAECVEAFNVKSAHLTKFPYTRRSKILEVHRHLNAIRKKGVCETIIIRDCHDNPGA